MIFVLRDMFSGKTFIIACVCFILAYVVSVCVHEFSHAFVAYKQGDPTPKVTGRVTLNPLAHLDPIGFLCALFFFVGWARPVKINPLNFKHYRKGMAWVSVAGIISNVIMAFISCGIYVALITYVSTTNMLVNAIIYFFMIMYIFNCSLAVFNLLPFAPLDGFNFLDSITKDNNKVVNFLRNYGYIILLGLLLFSSNLLPWLVNILSEPMLLFWGLIF